MSANARAPRAMPTLAAMDSPLLFEDSSATTVGCDVTVATVLMGAVTVA